MRGNTHVTFAVFLAVLIYFLFPGLNSHLSFAYFALIAGIASLVPDIDHPHSILSKGNLEFLSIAVRTATPHRKGTHSLIGAVFFTAFSGLLLMYFKGHIIYTIPFFLGYISHLASDSMNITGVPWGWPKGKKINIWNIRTGGEKEMTIRMFLTITGAGLFFYDMIIRNSLILE